jgi:hypothetical protein
MLHPVQELAPRLRLQPVIKGGRFIVIEIGADAGRKADFLWK